MPLGDPPNWRCHHCGCACFHAGCLHAPMDAPIRLREMEEEASREAWRNFIESPEGRAKLEEMVRDAAKRAGIPTTAGQE